MTTGLTTILVVGVGAAVPVGEVAPEDVSPGVLGFLVTFAVVAACVPLFRSMTSKVRGVQYRDQASAGGTSVDAARAEAVLTTVPVPDEGPVDGTSVIAAPDPIGPIEPTV